MVLGLLVITAGAVPILYWTRPGRRGGTPELREVASVLRSRKCGKCGAEVVHDWADDGDTGILNCVNSECGASYIITDLKGDE